MPQKKNPDAAELIRGKAGRAIGALIALLIVMKGMPLSYGKDMQEDKEPTFDAVDSLTLSVAAMAGMIRDLKADPQRMKSAAGAGYTTATDLADWLVRQLKLPFRDAHHITGAIVRVAETKGCELKDLPLSDMQAIEPRITADVLSVLSVDHSVASRASYGGTAPARVREAIARARRRLTDRG